MSKKKETRVHVLTKSQKMPFIGNIIQAFTAYFQEVALENDIDPTTATVLFDVSIVGEPVKESTKKQISEMEGKELGDLDNEEGESNQGEDKTE